MGRGNALVTDTTRVWKSFQTICIIYCVNYSGKIHDAMKKVLSIEETQTLRAEPKNFAPPGARDGQNLISWGWSLRLPTNPVW